MRMLHLSKSYSIIEKIRNRIVLKLFGNNIEFYINRLIFCKLWSIFEII